MIWKDFNHRIEAMIVIGEHCLQRAAKRPISMRILNLQGEIYLETSSLRNNMMLA